MTEAHSDELEIRQLQIRPQSCGWPAIPSRTERRPYSLDETRWIEPQDHRHRLPPPRRHRRGCEGGHIYWTNMGTSPPRTTARSSAPTSTARIARSSSRKAVTYTPKQINLDKENGKLYWCDREGMRVMRANLDGSQVETLVETGRGDADRRDQTRWCVGITIDPEARQIYWTQKGPDNGGWPSLPRQHRHSQGREPREPLRHRGAVRPLAGTDRPRARSAEPHPLLDRPRRSSARQHRQSRVRSIKSRRHRRS